ncbi:hypothetical protein ACBJ59_00635 [Nonomuraea sp. MTCD27]|uniref:hypothetical protein n=1 Tax=Nonomuraea sp. MTCD27 TaxID=1676747 RepID=UPI0035C26405
MTGYAVAAHAPERLTRLVAGGFDPDGFRSRVPGVLAALGCRATSTCTRSSRVVRWNTRTRLP